MKIARLKGSVFNKARRRTVKRARYAAVPVFRGEATQEMKINVYVFQLTDLNLFVAVVDLTAALTVVWVVEMGM